MDKVFLQIINMSITSCYVILFVIVARLFLKKAPKVFSYALWLVVLFRLLCPFSVESIFSLVSVNTQAIPQDIIYAQTPQIESGIKVIDLAVNSSLPAPAVGASVNPMQIWLLLGQVLWLLGIGALLMYGIFTTAKLSAKLKSPKHVSDNIYEVDKIKTAFVFGIIKPKIYLPTGLSEKERTYIIKHEETHIKRLDHIIKLFAYFVLCLHWFNPLVWVAFTLMSEDMELSCDESVIKEMGIDIKKDYSASLLSLSTGRRIIGGYPLAFGENNTKGRIINILNYKKPGFWVIFLTVIAVVAVYIGLISNPQAKQLTVEDYAWEFIEQEARMYEESNWKDMKIIDSKIHKLEKIATFEEMLSHPVEIWSLEFRLKPNVYIEEMPSGLRTDNGWITEAATDFGELVLVFTTENSKLKHLGSIRSIEADFSTPVRQEIALREFLERNELISPETYKGNHVVVKFPLSTGETCQLFLSQPAKQGEGGIWCVERWMGGNGLVYYDMPPTDGRIADYYQGLQEQEDAGQEPSLTDPLRVAIDYIKQDLNQWHVTFDDLIPQYEATVEDFLQTPESHFIGFISELKADKSYFHLDQIEWLTLDDTERLKELDIKPDELPNGFYIHNPKSYPMYCEVTQNTEYSIIDRTGNAVLKTVTREEFIKYFEEYSELEFTPPFRVVTKDGYVQSITEQYVP